MHATPWGYTKYAKRREITEYLATRGIDILDGGKIASDHEMLNVEEFVLFFPIPNLIHGQTADRRKMG